MIDCSITGYNKKIMTILYVCFEFPWPLNNGTRIRNYHLIAHLSQNHTITLVTLHGEKERSPCPLDQMCQKIIELDGKALLGEHSLWCPFGKRFKSLFLSPWPFVIQPWLSEKLIAAFKKLLTYDFDSVWVNKSYLGEAVRSAGFKNIILDVDDILSVVMTGELRHTPWYRSKPMHYVDLAKLFIYDFLLPFRFSKLIICKDEDSRYFLKNANVYVIPNGMTPQPLLNPDREAWGQILFVGTLSYLPNRDAVEFFCMDILPEILRIHSNATFHVVGRCPEIANPFDNNSTVLIHRNVSDVRPHYLSASLVVVPLRIGSGTRLKVLEALGFGKAVVVTSKAVEGLKLKSGVHLEIADDPKEFARICSRLLVDPAERHRLGKQGRDFVTKHYQWGTVSEAIDKVLGERKEVIAKAVQKLKSAIISLLSGSL